MARKAKLLRVPVASLQRGKFQPRVHFDEEALEELAQSIRNSGLLQPIVVRALADQRYEIVAGERRWRACQRAGLTEVDCLLNEFTDDQAAEAATIENVNRVDLNPIEEAKAYQRLIDEFSYLHEEIAATVGKSRAKITNTLRLLNLDSEVQTKVAMGELSEGHGKMLVGLMSQQQQALAAKVIKHAWSVRKLELEVKKLKNNSAGSEEYSDADVNYLSRSLSEHLGSPVKIDFSSGKGRLQIDFQNLDILDGILAKMRYQKADEQQ